MDDIKKLFFEDTDKAVVFLKRGIDYQLDKKIEGTITYKQNGVIIRKDEKRYFIPFANIIVIKLIGDESVTRIL